MTIAGERHALQEPFFVLATENPIPISLKLSKNRSGKWPTFIYEGELNKPDLPVANKEPVEPEPLVENDSSEAIALTGSRAKRGRSSAKEKASKRKGTQLIN